MTTTTVIGDALPGDLPEALTRSFGNPRALANKLGMWLRNRKGRWVDGYAVWSDDAMHARTTKWYVKHAE